MDDKLLATADAGGPLVSQPIDGLQVGRDEKGAVGSYSVPFAFPGTIERVEITVD